MAPLDFDFSALYKEDEPDDHQEDGPTANDSSAKQESTIAPSPTAAVEERMSEVERRLEIAQYYRLVLGSTLFTDSSTAAQTVESEIRDYVRLRLEELMGLKTPKSSQMEVFSEIEIQVLKALTSKVLNRPQEPQTAAMPAPKAPPKQKAPPPTPVKDPPQLKKVQTKKTQKPAPAPPVAQAPQAPVSSAPQAASPRPATSPRVPAGWPAALKLVDQAEEPKAEQGFIDQTTGKWYRWVYFEEKDKFVKMDITPRPTNPAAAKTRKVTAETRDAIARESEMAAIQQTSQYNIVQV